MDDFTWKILLLLVAFFGLIFVIVYAGSIRQWLFRRFQLRRLLRHHNWTDRTQPPELTRRELFVLRQREGTPTWQESLHITGTHRGYAFSAQQLYAYARVNANGEPQLVNKAFVEVYTKGLPAMRDVYIHPLTGKITTNPRTTVPPEFDQWLRENRRRCHQFTTGQGALSTRIGTRIFRGKLLRRLNYLIDATDHWPGATLRKRPR